MIYIFNIVFSCIYLSMVKEKKLSMLLLKVLPVIVLWVIIVGGQYDIGADYFNYYSYFKDPNLTNRFEPLFQIVSKFIYDFKKHPQAPFFVFATINAIVIFIVAHKIGVRKWGLFYFLFITASTFFNNQMNGLRQCIAIPLVCWGMIEMYQSRIKGTILIILAGGFHYSALVCLIFFYIRNIVNVVTKYPKLLLILTIVITCIPSSDTLNSDMISLLPSYIREETMYEQAYSDNDDLAATTDWIYKFSKLLFIPIYFISLKLMTKGKLTNTECDFFKLGLMSYFLRCVLLINNLIGRFSGYFWIFSILPIYYLASEYWKQQKYIKLIFLLIYCSAIYFIKVIVGTAEYKSSFIYFQ